MFQDILRKVLSYYTLLVYDLEFTTPSTLVCDLEFTAPKPN